MLPSIELDDQAGLEADEVDDVRADRALSKKLHSHHATRPQVVPESLLSVSRLGAQRAGEVEQGFRGRHRLMVDSRQWLSNTGDG